MTTTSHLPGTFNSPSQLQARIHRATVSMHPLTVALAADCALLDTPACVGAVPWTDTGGVYSVSFVRSPGARFVRLELRVSPVSIGTAATVKVKLDIRDASGASVASTDPRVPRGFKDETQEAPQVLLVEPRFALSLPVVGYLDCDALDDDLTDASWSLDFTIAVTGGAEVDCITVWELPRFVVDDGATHGGIIPGSFQRDAVVHNGTVDGLTRLLATLDSARQVQRSYLSLAWRQQTTVTTETPQISSTSDAPIPGLDAGAGRAEYSVTPRSIHAASSAGESVRFRLLYKMVGGAGTETATVRLRGSATGSPWSIVLPYSSSWVWSDWTDAAVRTSPLSDALSLSGKVSSSGAVAWIAGIHVAEAVL